MTDDVPQLPPLGQKRVTTRGQVITFKDTSGQIRIRSDALEGAGELALVSHADILGDPSILSVGDDVEFDLVRTNEGWQAKNVQRTPLVASATHSTHCFVVMPYGRTSDEIRWFRGWYEMVIKKAVAEAGYVPILAATEERPNAINDEIRSHLTFDSMVVVDLGGASPEADPNPNVMYELGIRHALGLPLVMMGWKNQRLPFDVGNQRVIMETRELLDLDINKTKLMSFIQAASEGHFYRPMDAVGRAATLEFASASLGKDSVLGLLTQEVRDLKNQFFTTKQPKPPKSKAKPKPPPSLTGMKLLLYGHQKGLYKAFKKAGGNTVIWGKLLAVKPSNDFATRASVNTQKRPCMNTSKPANEK